MGWDLMGSFRIGTTSGTPTLFASENLIKYLVLNKLIRDLQFVVSTSGDNLSDRFALTGLMAEGYQIATAKPSDWKLA